MFIDAFVVFFCPHGSFKRRFFNEITFGRRPFKEEKNLISLYVVDM